MFNPDLAEKYIDDNKNIILRLFSMYQIIEMVLFVKLYCGSFPSDLENEIEFTQFSKLMGSKTLGKIINEYKKRYKNDEFNLLGDLERMRLERNNFMHSMWIILAVCNSAEEAQKHADFMINKYNDTATRLFKSVLDPKVLSS